MLTGYNTDIKHEGIVYHVQTEDGGTGNPVIVSLVYQGGRILASRRTSYAELLGTEEFLPRLRDLLEKQHGDMIQSIRNGTLGSSPAKEPAPETGATVSQAPQGHQEKPVQPKPSAAPGIDQAQPSASEKNLDQVILEYLASEIDND
jgi:hypothetical protein